jgi:integrase
MTSSTSDRYTWKRVNGLWTKSIGPRGSRIRLFEKTKDGYYYCDVYTSGRNVRTSLGTRNRADAERKGKEILSDLLSGRIEEESSVLTLGSLWERFRTECAKWRDNGARSKKDDERSSKVLVGFFGDTADVSMLSSNELETFETAREAGGIKLPDGELTKPVRARAIQADLELLRMMCIWAMKVRRGKTGRLLRSSPFEGFEFTREANERRPIATIERFKATRKAINQLRKRDKLASGKLRWFKIELALILAEATGRRLNSIRLLRWADVDFLKSEIKWRADSDKMGIEWEIPIPKKLLKELSRFRIHLSAIGGWVFPSEQDAAKPMDRYQFDKWLRVAEQHAGLEKLNGGLWHPYRRKWATEKKPFPIADVMAAGGWKDSATLVKCYQLADHATLLKVMNGGRKRSEKTS